jgi:hypothetical protein
VYWRQQFWPNGLFSMPRIQLNRPAGPVLWIGGVTSRTPLKTLYPAVEYATAKYTKIVQKSSSENFTPAF